MYLHLETLTQCTERDIRAAFPNTSFPYPFSPPEGYAWIFPSPQPEHNRVTKSVREVTPVLTSKGHWEQRWEVVPLFSEYTDSSGVLHTIQEQEAVAIANDNTLIATLARETAKQSRQVAVENITVTTSAGNTFDGDEASQTRMARAILVLSSGAASTVTWVLADNTVIQATEAELTEALAKAGAAQASMWVI